jgi:hypothetical protein
MLLLLRRERRKFASQYHGSKKESTIKVKTYNKTCLNCTDLVQYWVYICKSKRRTLLSLSLTVICPMLTVNFEPGLGPTNKNTLKNSLNSCQIFKLLKLLTKISDYVHMKQFKITFLEF